MKKLYYMLLLAAFTFTVSGISQAQELILNGDLEAWDDPNNPTSWNKAENITQAASPVHGGSYSAQHTSSSDGTQDLQQDVSGIIGGATYTISYWFYDFSTEARTRIWSYWLDGTTYLDDNQQELRPGTYSENNTEWQHYTYTLTAPANADGFRFEVRVYGEDGNTGGVVYYDDFSIQGAGIQPEPTNYPTDFTAEASGISISLEWTDAIGEQLPNAYLIKVANVSNILPPEDGIAVADDFDLTDGEGAYNAAYGEEMCTFDNLDGNTQYFFVIFPYTNGGSDVDYKTDGTPPQVSATTADINVVLSQNFDDGFGSWQTISVVGDQIWEIDDIHGVNGTPCAKMNGYSGAPLDNEDWLISPALDLSEYGVVTLSYMTAMNYSGPELEVLASTDYDGGGDPNSASWESLGGTLSGGSWAWTASGAVDMTTAISPATYLAFKYTSTTSQASTWEVDNIIAIAGGLSPEPTNYPGDFAATATGPGIKLSWTDAIGEQLPSGYLVLGSSESIFTAPADGTPVSDDADLSDGSAALNVAYGNEMCNFDGLGTGETYYFTIYPYANAGVNIDYKVDGTAPTASATTANVVIIEEQGFDQDWGDWQRISVLGDQVWTRDNTFGVNGTPCAQISGYDNGTFYENEDWLISPPMNFDDYTSEIFSFQSAMNYNGPAPDVLIATNYDGTDPYSGNWQTIECELSSGGWEWTPSGDIDVSGYDGETVYVAFVFVSSNSESATWEFDEIKITGVEVIGIDEVNSFTAEVSIYPNPAANRIYISINGHEEITARIFSLNGTAVSEEVAFKGSTSIGIENLARGFYLVRFTDMEGNTKTEKLMVE